MDDTMKKAVKYISDILRDTPTADKLKLIEDTSKQFDLNPMQTDFLTNKIINGK